MLPGKRPAAGPGEQVQIESEISIRLPGDAIGISQQSKAVAVSVSNTKSCLRAELMFHGQTPLLNIRTAESRRENDEGWSSARAGRKRGQAVGVGHRKRRAGRTKRWPNHDEKGSGYSVRSEGLRYIQQILLNVEQAEGATHHCASFTVERVRETYSRGDVILTVGNVAGEGERGIAFLGLREHLQVVAQAVV